ncbi:MAG TPA: carboxymuconolactone decarboxylase family protein [Solirubrobacteraceae bacterium]|nr:carboxymuconolactone decarboxylase family protein [Solirubrobacteraceae bacterium]
MADGARPPRIAPGRPAEIGRVNTLITRALGAATGGGPPNLFTTLARHRRLFRPWLRFAGVLMPGGRLPRADTELLILRTAHTTGCAYEWRHHEHLGRAAGLTAEQIARVREGPEAVGWEAHQSRLLRAADALRADGALDDELWAALRERYDEAQMIELCMLVGHYVMLAMTINTLQIVPDALPSTPPRLARAGQALLRRRRGR